MRKYPGINILNSVIFQLYIQRKAFYVGQHLFKISVLFLSLFFTSVSFGQRTCGTHEHLLDQLEANPRFRQKLEQIEQHTQKTLAGPIKAFLGTITIPVHVIVVYSNSSQNISEAQILSQIAVLNEDYQKLNADWTSTPTEFIGAVADFEIEFVLQAVERHSDPTAEWGTADAVKVSYPPYLPATHLNLWVCNIGEGILGYAQFPGGPASTDGVVISPQFVGSSDYDDGSFYLTAPYDKGRTATHEIGHWLNLRHIWADDQNTSNTCSYSDFVDDTPNQAIMYYGCPAHPQNSCGSNDMFMNYMDYVDDACMFMFTEGQKNRSQAIFVPGGPRASFVTSASLICDVDACDGAIGLSLTLDNYPSETSWSLVESDGTLIDQGLGYSISGETVTDSWSLDPGTYIFTIYDSYGDGICCDYGSGSFTLTDGCEGTLLAGGDFEEYDQIVFCVPESAEINLTSPNGGENWNALSVHAIAWTSSGTSGSVKIEYSDDNGSSWSDIVAITNDDGTFDWTLPDISSTQCLVRISDADGTPVDQSDAVFSITSAPSPEISVNPAVSLEFRDVLFNSYSDMALEISNEGDAALEISSIDISGTNATLFNIQSGGGAATIPAGSNRSVLIRFEPGSGGVKSASLIITNNDPDENPYTVLMNGTGSAPDIDISPAAYTFPAPVAVGSDANSTGFSIQNTGTANLSIFTHSLSGPDAASFSLLPEIAENTVITPGGSESFVVRFQPDRYGSHTAYANITSNDPDEAFITIPVTAVGQAPDINATPGTVQAGDVFLGESVTLTIAVSNVGNDDLAISASSISGTGAAEFSIQSGGGPQTIAAGGSLNIDLLFAPSSTGMKSAMLNIESNDPDEGIYQINLSGNGVSPEIEVTPDPLSFGDILSGETYDIAIEVANTGNGDLEIYSTAVSGTDASSFSVQTGGEASVIAPGNTRDIVIRFAPLVLGVKTASLIIGNNDMDESTYNLSLSGTCIPDNSAPYVDIPDQVTDEGGSFVDLHLDDYVIDDHTADEYISWYYTGNTELGISIVDRVCRITIPDDNWYGTETITFTAWDNNDTPLSDEDAVLFTVNPVNDPPVVSDIPDQVVETGVSFAAIFLDDYVEDPETTDDNIIWDFEGNKELSVDITGRVVYVSVPSPDWIGTETIQFTATDDDPSLPLAGSDEVAFEVICTNTVPFVGDIPDQTINAGNSFSPVNLDDYVEDAETPDEDITWTVSGNTDIVVSIDNRIASFSTADGWAGSETLTFTATDNALCQESAKDEIVLTVLDPETLSASIAGTQIRIYPNPGHDKLNVTFSDPVDEEIEIRIINALGQTKAVHHYNFVEEDLQLNVNSFPRGNYLIMIISRDQSIDFPVVLE